MSSGHVRELPGYLLATSICAFTHPSYCLHALVRHRPAKRRRQWRRREHDLSTGPALLNPTARYVVLTRLPVSHFLPQSQPQPRNRRRHARTIRLSCLIGTTKPMSFARESHPSAPARSTLPWGILRGPPSASPFRFLPAPRSEGLQAALGKDTD